MRNNGEVYKSVVAKVSSGAANMEDAEMRERLARTNTLEEASADGRVGSRVPAVAGSPLGLPVPPVGVGYGSERRRMDYQSLSLKGGISEAAIIARRID